MNLKFESARFTLDWEDNTRPDTLKPTNITSHILYFAQLIFFIS